MFRCNTINNKTGLPILPPITIKFVGGVPVGFIGMTLEGTAGIVNPAGIKNVHFADEIETANKWSNVLKLFGVKAQVLLLHEGGAQGSATPTPGVSDCYNFSGPIVNIVKGLNPDATEPLMLANTGHPAADRFALARASKSHVHAFGLNWDDVSGTNNGQYAPFTWSNA